MAVQGWPGTASGRRDRPAVGPVAAVLLAAALGWAYAPNWYELGRRWWHDENYSYGFFVPPIALAILGRRRAALDGRRLAPSWWGTAALAAVLALRGLLYEANERWWETATIPLAVAGLAWALGGRHLLGWSLPAVGFLAFMLPLPPRVNALLARPLQRLATLGSAALLQALGVPVLAEGNVILVGDHPLEVARACNGLSMLLSFVTLITAVAILVPRPPWQRLVLLASAVPIALASNILRIAATAWCYHQLGPQRGHSLAHDLAGWLMMPVALALVLLELGLLSRLVVDPDGPAPQPSA
jgi:exosortase